MTQKADTRTTNEVAQRLRDWRYAQVPEVGVLCEDGAREIDRLQKVIDDYVYIAKASAKEIRQLRTRTNLDAVPAAIARTDAESDRTDKAAPRPGKGAGNTPVTQHTPGKCSSPRACTSEPVAWAVVSDSKEEIDCEFIYPDEATAGDVALDSNGGVVPLYRQPQPTLTDAEREAVNEAIRRLWGFEIAATLRGLLERTK